MANGIMKSQTRDFSAEVLHTMILETSVETGRGMGQSSRRRA
jgi:hypothetical protein